MSTNKKLIVKIKYPYTEMLSAICGVTNQSRTVFVQELIKSAFDYIKTYEPPKNTVDSTQNSDTLKTEV